MRGTLIVAASVALLAAGCMPTKPGASAGSDQACMAENARFADAWICIRSRIVARQKEGTGHPDGLIDEGDLLAEQVRSGKVSDAEARKRLSTGLAHDAS